MSDYERKTPKPERPDDNLPPRELQKKWNEYLNAHVGRPGARPRWEMLIPPQELERMNIPELAKIKSPRMDLYRKACITSLRKLPLLQRVVIKSYFGIDRPDAETQAEIARKVGIDQSNVNRWLQKTKEALRTSIRREVARLAKEEIRAHKISL